MRLTSICLTAVFWLASTNCGFDEWLVRCSSSLSITVPKSEKEDCVSGVSLSFFRGEANDNGIVRVSSRKFRTFSEVRKLSL